MIRNTSRKTISISFGIVTMLIIAGIASGVIRIHLTNSVSEENNSFIRGLGAGYNIGNSLDACDWSTMFKSTYGNDTETFWGTPAITDEFVELLSEQGFGVVRVPVTYMNHIDENGNIDKQWLERVVEVADMIISHGMYCIIDIHHDTGNDGWIRATEKNYADNKERVQHMITQIAVRFENYDEHLILESFNEMVDEKCHWQKVPISSHKTFNKWNQLFVDTIRATGGNNSDRYLLINTYAATVNAANIYFFDMPRDSAKDRLIAGVHNYTGPEKLEKSFEIINLLNNRGYPVIIGEFGNTANASYDRFGFVNKFVEKCREYGYCPIWWDNGQDPAKNPDSSFALFWRDSCEVCYPEIVGALTSMCEDKDVD